MSDSNKKYTDPSLDIPSGNSGSENSSSSSSENKDTSYSNADDSSSEPVFPKLNPSGNDTDKTADTPVFPSFHDFDDKKETPKQNSSDETLSFLSIHSSSAKTSDLDDTEKTSDVSKDSRTHNPDFIKPIPKKPESFSSTSHKTSEHAKENNTTRVYSPLRETPEETVFKEKERRKQNKKQKRFAIITSILVVIVCIEIIVCVCGVVLVGRMVSTAPALDVSDFVGEESSRIYDDSGALITEIGTYYRENITYDKCPESLVDAFLSVEDSRFFTHFGFDIPRFTKAIIENLKSHDFSQGGSTFTMQLVKNTYFTVDNGDSSVERTKSIEYKVQQIWLSIKLEKILNKKEIFQLYMNKLNFGGRIRGVQKASKYYFGKNSTDLTLTESAMLAGIVNLPNGYNPYYHLDEATERRNQVLNLMKYHGYLTSDECELAKIVKVEDELVGENYVNNVDVSSSNQYQSYIDAVLDESEKMTGQDPTIKGMQIYTYMNKTVQDQIESIQDGSSTVNFPNDLMQCAMISVDNTNGAIVGIGGGRNYNTGARLLNRATSQYKQPGSSIKPVLS
ncbi:MAG: hypothetical protein EOM64_09110, partial [Erysipelotrichia bacterium]|nr:hypothetical protein [Erysipelotrichia bacterium]